MNLLSKLATEHPVANAILVLSLVAVVGLALGKVNVRGIGLGIAGVLFAGIAFGHFGFEIDHTILEFTREFGLVLFVYTIGMQVGPGFFSSLRKQGLSLNSMAIITVGLSVGIALLIGRLLHLPIAAVVGLFSGATTNTPSLGAAQEALKNLPGVTPTEAALPALAYAAAYPFGIMGIIMTMLLLRWLFHIDSKKEALAFRAEQGIGEKHLHRMNILVNAEAYDGVKLGDIEMLKELKVVVTRIYNSRDKVVSTASPESYIHICDTLIAVGEKADVEKFCNLIGRPAWLDLMKEQGQVLFRDIVVTRKEVIGQPLSELDLEEYGVATSRVMRSGIELTALPNVKLQFGDRVRVIGESEPIKRAIAILGNSTAVLNHTHFIPVFVGIALGVFVGMLPVQIFGMPAPVSLGLAGGPLVVAILLSRMGRFGPLVWYMPLGANLALRELGIILFLGCVGLKAGGRFVEILVHGDGLLWMVSAAFITMVPLLIIGLFARIVLRQNFMNICGLLSGTMTDPPALAFANSISESDAPSVAYATVYPLTMLARIIAAQGIVLFFH